MSTHHNAQAQKEHSWKKENEKMVTECVCLFDMSDTGQKIVLLQEIRLFLFKVARTSGLG